MKHIKVNVIFTFDIDETKSDMEIVECIQKQIFSDCNVYYQNDDDTAQMTNLEVKV